MTRILLSSPSIAGPAQSEEENALPSSRYSLEADGLVRRQIIWRRGSFRFWIVGSALYVIVVAAINFREIKTSLVNLSSIEWMSLDGGRFVPTRCSDARGVIGKDFTQRAEFPDLCWYDLAKFRGRYPEYANQSETELEAKLYAAVDKPLPATRPTPPWTTLLNWIGIVVGIPLDALMLGAAIGWACSGFKSSTSAPSHRPR